MPHGRMKDRVSPHSRKLSLPLPSLEPPQKLKVAIFEDADIILDLYKDRFGKMEGISLVNSQVISTVAEALSIFVHEKPDLSISDLSLTDGHTEGFSILRAIKKCSPGSLVALSTSIYSPNNHDDLTEHIRMARFDAVFHKVDLDNMAAYLMKVRDARNGDGFP